MEHKWLRSLKLSLYGSAARFLFKLARVVKKYDPTETRPARKEQFAILDPFAGKESEVRVPMRSHQNQTDFSRGTSAVENRRCTSCRLLVSDVFSFDGGRPPT